MDGNKTFTKLREGYSNLLIYTLKNNIKKTVQNVNVDASVIQHYGLTIEEDCFNRNPSDLAAYTKAITAARLSIESYTSKEQPYPTISNALQLNDMERLPNETSAVDHVTGEVTRSKHDQPEPKSQPKAALVDEVIVIDSSDSEDEHEAMITDDVKSQKAKQTNNTMGEILISVQTESSKAHEA